MRPPAGEPLEPPALPCRIGDALSSEYQRLGSSDSIGRSRGGSVALDLIRQAFVREIEMTLDWPAVFAALWSPIEALLAFRPTTALERRSPPRVRLAAGVR